MSMNEKLAYLAETKEQIKEALINKGATINSGTTFRSYVDKINAIKTINNQTKEVTENGTYTPDEGYTGLGSVVVNVQGSGGASTGVKKFATVEDMQADTTGKEGDMAILYAGSLGNMSVDMEVQVVKFPMTVKLPSAFSGSVYTMLRSTDGSFDAQVQLSATRFRFTGYNESGSINVNYTSTDGINYARTDGGSETIDFGTTIKCQYVEEWDDNIGYFMLISSAEFNGLFEYTLLKDTDSIYFPLKSAAITTDWDNNLNDVPISKQKLEPLLKKMYTELRSNSNFKIAIFQTSTNQLHAFTYDISYAMGTFADDNGSVYIGIRSSSSNSTISSCKPKEYILDLENQTYTYYTSWTFLAYSRVFNGSTYVMYHFNGLDAKTCVYNVFSTTNSNIDYYYWDGALRITSQSNSNSNYDAYKRFYLSWELAPNQLTVSKSSDLLPDKIAYGKTGVVLGDDSFYDNTFKHKILNNIFGVSDALESCPTVAITTQSLKFNTDYKPYQVKRFIKGSSTDYRLGIIDTSKTPTRISITSSGTSNASGMEVCSDAVVRFTGSDTKLFVCAMNDGTILKGGLSYNYKEYCFPYKGNLYFVGTTASGLSNHSVLKLNSSSLGSYTNLGTACDTSSKVMGLASDTIWSINTSSSGTNAGKLYKFNLSTNKQTTQSLGAMPYQKYLNVDGAVYLTGVQSSDNTKIRFMKLTNTVEIDVLLPRPAGTLGNQTVMYIDDSGSEPIYYIHHSIDNYMYSYQESVGYTKLHYCQYSGRNYGIVINNGLISCYGIVAYTIEEWLNNDTYFPIGNYPVCGGKFLKNGKDDTTHFIDVSDVEYIKETPEGQSSEIVLSLPETTGEYVDSSGLSRGYMCHKL